MKQKALSGFVALLICASVMWVTGLFPSQMESRFNQDLGLNMLPCLEDTFVESIPVISDIPLTTAQDDSPLIFDYLLDDCYDLGLCAEVLDEEDFSLRADLLAEEPFDQELPEPANAIISTGQFQEEFPDYFQNDFRKEGYILVWNWPQGIPDAEILEPVEVVTGKEGPVGFVEFSIRAIVAAGPYSASQSDGERLASFGLIPNQWDNYILVLPNTLWVDGRGNPCFACLYRNGTKWVIGAVGGDGWDSNFRVLTLRKTSVLN
ncbi:MAG: hypothetical protein WC797_03995 [Candidatus Paceibacterota bacterium]|jgi:hypothetical protein